MEAVILFAPSAMLFMNYLEDDTFQQFYRLLDAGALFRALEFASQRCQLVCPLVHF